MSALIGRVLGQNYRVVEPIGAGAMGMVYVVEHLTLKKRFAAKVLTADLARHPEAVARFEVEAYAASQLDHENIISVIDFGRTDDGCVFLIMELLRGKTLQARMDQGPPSIEEIVAIVLQVCRALAAAHAAGIVHRDMKPENIFLTQRPGGRPMVKVLDFGISKAREPTLRDGRITKQGQLLGSPEYMSPEASRGDEVDSRADIYAVGIMLYELLCGEVPFRHENYLKVLQMHAGVAPRAPSELVPDMPAAVEQLILRALQKDPRFRHGSVEELEAELLAALPEVAQRAMLQIQTPPHSQWLPRQSQPMMIVSETNPGFAEGSDAAYVPVGQAGVSTLDTRQRGRRGILVGLWGGAAVLSTAAGILFFLQQGESDGAEAPADAPRAVPAGTSPEAVADAPDAPVRPGEVRLRVDTTPSGAVVTLGGVRLGRTPLDTQVASSDTEGELELELRGYKSMIRSIPLDRGSDIDVALQRESRRSRRSGGEGRSGKSSSGRSSRRNSEDDERAERPPAVDLDIKEGR